MGATDGGGVSLASAAATRSMAACMARPAPVSLSLMHSSPSIPPSTLYARWGKRLLDLILVVPVLTGFLLLWPLLWVLVRWGVGRPVLIRQRRVGYRGRLFTLYKLRTLRGAPLNQASWPHQDDPRLTPISRWLRTFGVDELPQLWNVLKGEMSLVGPRPLLPDDLPEEHHWPLMPRHQVRPGLTGWAQIQGRNSLDLERRYELDAWYAAHVSLWLDLRILFQTLVKLMRREGAWHPKERAMKQAADHV